MKKKKKLCFLGTGPNRGFQHGRWDVRTNSSKTDNYVVSLKILRALEVLVQEGLNCPTFWRIMVTRDEYWEKKKKRKKMWLNKHDQMRSLNGTFIVFRGPDVNVASTFILIKVSILDSTLGWSIMCARGTNESAPSNRTLKKKKKKKVRCRF